MGNQGIKAQTEYQGIYLFVCCFQLSRAEKVQYNFQYTAHMHISYLCASLGRHVCQRKTEGN